MTLKGGGSSLKQCFALVHISLILFCINNGLLYVKFLNNIVEPQSVSKISYILRKYFEDAPNDSGPTLFNSTKVPLLNPAFAAIRPLVGAVYNSKFLSRSANYTLIRYFTKNQPSPYHGTRFCPSKQSGTPWILEFRGVWMDDDGNVFVPERMDADVVVARHYSLGGGCCEKDWKTSNATRFNRAKGCRHRLAFSLAQNHGCSPWHVLSELLPRLFSFWDIARKIVRKRGVVVVCSRTFVPFNFLAAIGIPGHSIARDHGLCYFDRLLVPEPILQGNYPQKCLIEATENILVETLLQDAPPLPKNPLILIIDRAKSRFNRKCTGSRCISNLPELVESIKSQWPNSVSVYSMGNNENDMVRTSARLFYHATVVVGMHGGGFANIIYMRRNANTSVIQIGWQGGLSKLYAGFTLKRQIIFRNIVTKGASHTSSNVEIDVSLVILEIYRALQRAGHQLKPPATSENKPKSTSLVQTAEEMLAKG